MTRRSGEQRQASDRAHRMAGLSAVFAGISAVCAVSMSTDTDGYYAMDYQVAGQRIGVGDLEMTGDDVIARWHQRSSSHDFMTGDTVIVKATRERATAFASTARVNADGSTDEGWMIASGSNLTFVLTAEIRIATREEVGQDGS